MDRAPLTEALHMGLITRSGISFCEVSDRLLFLDLYADRYFLIAEDAERSLREVIGGCCFGPEQRQALGGLLRAGVLLETNDDRVPQCFESPSAPTTSLLDGGARPARLRERLNALSMLSVARVQLRFVALHVILGRLEASKSSQPDSASYSSQRLQEVADAFEWTSRMIRSHDQCLARSLAATRRLTVLGVPAELVIGVRLRPFAAHSWAQVKHFLVNDHIDTVRTDTPILAI